MHLLVSTRPVDGEKKSPRHMIIISPTVDNKLLFLCWRQFGCAIHSVCVPWYFEE